MERKRLPSPNCFIVAGAVFLLYGLLFPLYRLSHYIIAAALAAGAYFISKKLLPSVDVEIEKAPETTGDALADGALREGREYLAELGNISSKIKSEKVRGHLAGIGKTVEAIMAAITDQPKKAPMVRRLMSYYLPTLIKLSDFYERLESQPDAGENVKGSMERIEGNLATLDSALKKQLDLLYEEDALDISTDIQVMENMLAQEGLKGGLGEE